MFQCLCYIFQSYYSQIIFDIVVNDVNFVLNFIFLVLSNLVESEELFQMGFFLSNVIRYSYLKILEIYGFVVNGLNW